INGSDQGTFTLTSGHVVYVWGLAANDSIALTGTPLTTFVDGGTGSNTLDLSARTTATTFNIIGVDSGTVGAISFTRTGSLKGGSGNDTFAASGSGSISGVVNGGAGSDTVTDAVMSVAVTVSLSALANVETVVGGSSAGDMLVGTNAATTWNVTGTHSGTVG